MSQEYDEALELLEISEGGGVRLIGYAAKQRDRALAELTTLNPNDPVFETEYARIRETYRVWKNFCGSLERAKQNVLQLKQQEAERSEKEAVLAERRGSFRDIT